MASGDASRIAGRWARENIAPAIEKGTNILRKASTAASNIVGFSPTKRGAELGSKLGKDIGSQVSDFSMTEFNKGVRGEPLESEKTKATMESVKSLGESVAKMSKRQAYEQSEQYKRKTANDRRAMGYSDSAEDLAAFKQALADKARSGMKAAEFTKTFKKKK